MKTRGNHQPSTLPSSPHSTTDTAYTFASNAREPTMVEEIQASAGGATNGFKIKDTNAMEEEEKAEEQAPVESAEESGGNQTQPLAQSQFSNVDQQSYGNSVETISPPGTLAMEDDDADEPSLHEDDLEPGMNEAPGSSILDAKLGGSLRQVSFHEDLDRHGNHDSLKDLSSHNHDTSTQGSISYRDQTEMGGESMDSMDYNNHVEQLKDASGSSAPDEAKFVVKDKKRVSLVVDIEGKEGTRAQTALIRDQSQCLPTSVGARRRRGVKQFISQNTLRNPLWGYAADRSDKEDSDDSIEAPVHGRLKVHSAQVVVDDAMEGDSNALEMPESQRKHIETQYRLQALAPGTGKFSDIARGFGFSVGNGVYEEPPMSQDNGCSCFGLNPNKMVVGYLNWAFRSSFTAVFFSAAAAFFGLCTGFAILIYASGTSNPKCVYVNGVEFGTSGADFSDAFALSWTTFSTVGYGLIFPATSTTTGEVRQCTGITILTCAESFVGILFASVCGAIVFAKVTRIASFAQVIFSEGIVIRYGDGVSNVDNDENSDNEEAVKSEEITLSKLPCPLLEFRVINRLHAELGGEIIDATMNIVASIDEKQASHALRNSANNTRRRGKKGKRRRGVSKRKLQSSADFTPVSQRKYNSVRDSLSTMFASAAHKNNQRMDEDPTGMIVPRRIFAKLEIESPEHPFFKRVWLARHTLNHHSPLLRQEARELVRLNGGHWPNELNNAEAVRASVHFDQIIVSLSGTSNVDANSVYAQKVYDFVDVCIGYRFINLLYRDERDGGLAVDSSLLNDVTEQNGGGGENLNAVKDNTFIL